MPFTISHAALAPPLHRLLGQRLPLSGLVIGSMMPDLPYFVLGRIAHGRLSHSAVGLVLICLPAGLALFFLFHGVLRAPLTRLLPVPLQQRLRALPLPAVERRRTWLAAALAILLGAASHLAWDSFTHSWGAGVQALPFLLEPVAVVGERPLRACMLLQWLSGVLGLLALGVFFTAWYRRAPLASLHEPPIPWPRRLGIVVAILSLAGVAATSAGFVGASQDAAVFHRVHTFLVYSAVVGVSTTTVLCMLYATAARLAPCFRSGGDDASRRGYT
jgi:Domain of unknown function (DUF4184)